MNNQMKIRAESGRVPSTGTSVPMDLGCFTFPVHICSPTWRPSAPYTVGILWRLPHIGMINSITRPSPLSVEVGVCVGGAGWS